MTKQGNKTETERLLGDTSNGHTNGAVEEGSREVYTLEEGINALQMGLFQYLLMLYVSLAWASDGLEMMALSYLGPAAKCEFDLTSAQKSFITSIVFIGMLFGAYTWGAISDALGRKFSFTGTATLTVLAGFASGFSPNYAALVTFRGLVGFGLGGVPVAFSLFLEFIPSKQRGRISIAMQISWGVGAILEALLAWAVMPTWGWRALLVCSTAPLVVLLALFPLLPESPHFLVSKGRIAEAEAVLARMAKINGATLPPGKLIGPKIIRKVDPDMSGFAKMKSFLTNMLYELKRTYSRQHVRTSAILHTSWLVNAFAYYGLVLLTTELHTQEGGECKGSELAPMPSSSYRDIAITTLAESVGQFIGIFIIDFIGRIKSMAISMGLCSLALVPLLAFKLSPHGATAFLFIARGSSLLSFSVLYSYSAEYYPTSMRSFSLGLCNVWARMGGLVAPFAVVDLVDSGHVDATEIMLIIICGATAVATMFLRKETAGQRLPDDDDEAAEEATSQGKH